MINTALILAPCFVNDLYCLNYISIIIPSDVLARFRSAASIVCICWVRWLYTLPWQSAVRKYSLSLEPQFAPDHMRTESCSCTLTASKMSIDHIQTFQICYWPKMYLDLDEMVHFANHTQARISCLRRPSSVHIKNDTNRSIDSCT